MLSLDDGRVAVRFARRVVESAVQGRKSPEMDLPKIFDEEWGAFVTLHRFPEMSLRGCIGYPLPLLTLREAIAESGRGVIHDPRFLPLAESELESVIVEVSVLTAPEEIVVKDPLELLNHIQVGRDGLMVEQERYRGLLLPQVAVEQEWDNVTFLDQTCVKAGLFADAWRSGDVRVMKFSGMVFSEIAPCGEVEEKQLA